VPSEPRYFSHVADEKSDDVGGLSSVAVMIKAVYGSDALGVVEKFAPDAFDANPW
jgi:hypothetical protein